MLLDTSAWIEFFIKSKKGELVKNILKRDKCYTSILTISEISNWAIKENLNGKDLTKFIIESTEILNLNPNISFLAGELNFKRKMTIKNWGIVDSLILATSLSYNLKILTKDFHFKDLSNAQIL